MNLFYKESKSKEKEAKYFILFYLVVGVLRKVGGGGRVSDFLKDPDL